MSKQIKKVHHASALPIYGMALIFFVLALILPIYKLWAIILDAAITAGGWYGLTRLYPGRDEEIEEEVLTGNAELDAQIIESRSILERFRSAAEKAGDEKVKTDITRIINAAEGIIDEVIADAGDRGDAFTFFVYYLPTLDKLLTYYTGFAITDKGENAVESRARIENCLDMVAEAFERFLDKLYRNEALAIKASVQVMKTMLSSDGLAEKKSSGSADPVRDIESISSQLRDEANREQGLTMTSN